MHVKVNISLFILGALLSILGGVFEFSSSFVGANILILIIIGFLIGLLNIDVTEEAGFLLSALVFVVSVSFIRSFMVDIPALQNISTILTNFALLTASATAIVSLRWVVNFTSSIKKKSIETKEEKQTELAKFEKFWAVVMLIAVAIVLVQVVLESFFDVTSYQNILNVVDILILFVFVIDLVMIYIETKKTKAFFKHAWLDIIATIPFNFFVGGNLGLVRSLKVVRLVRIMKVFKVQKVAKLLRINRALKFFSKKSKFNVHLDDKEK